jgi:hypothetical protein
VRAGVAVNQYREYGKLNADPLPIRRSPQPQSSLDAGGQGRVRQLIAFSCADALAYRLSRPGGKRPTLRLTPEIEAA